MGSKALMGKKLKPSIARNLGLVSAPRSLVASASAPKGARCLMCRGKDPAIRVSFSDRIFVWVCGDCENLGVKAIKLSLFLQRIFK